MNSERFRALGSHFRIRFLYLGRFAGRTDRPLQRRAGAGSRSCSMALWVAQTVVVS